MLKEDGVKARKKVAKKGGGDEKNRYTPFYNFLHFSGRFNWLNFVISFGI